MTYDPVMWGVYTAMLLALLNAFFQAMSGYYAHRKEHDKADWWFALGVGYLVGSVFLVIACATFITLYHIFTRVAGAG